MKRIILTLALLVVFAVPSFAQRPIGGGSAAAGGGDASAANQTTAIGHLSDIENGITLTFLEIQDQTTLMEAAAAEDVAHDEIDTGKPVKIGGKAIALSANPTGVAANDRTNAYFTRAGQLFTIGGHPNIITETATVLDADGAQTGTAIVTVSAGTKIVLTAYGVKCSAANTGNVDFVLAFDTDATFPAATTTGTVGIIDSQLGIEGGGGHHAISGSGILGIGADGEDLRFSLGDPAGGGCTVTVKYFTIEG